jgi:hypothetical protein
MALLVFALVGAMFSMAVPASAAPSTLVVDDNLACPGATYSTISAAVTAASNGDTIQVCAGTYNEQVRVTKALSILGAGAATTIIDGGNAALPFVGQVSIQTDAGNVTFSGFTIRHAGTSSGVRAALFSKVTVAGSGNDTLIENNVVEGSGAAGGADYGYWTDHSFDDLTFQDNTISDTDFNAVLIETHAGSVVVDDNQVEAGITGSSAIFDMAYIEDITTPHNFTNNTIDAATGGGISINGAFGGAGVGAYTDVDVSDNVISNLGGTRLGISLRNGAGAPGTAGEISDATVTDNQISGSDAAGSKAIRLGGLVSNATVTGNTIQNVDRAFSGELTSGVGPTGTLLNDNSFSSDLSGVFWQGTEVLDATENWWGAASGPLGSTAGPPASWGVGTGDAVSAEVDFFPWYTNSGMTTLRACDLTATPGVKLFGTKNADVLCGSASGDTINGKGGKDLILGGGGADALKGGPGDDALIGDAGDDRLAGNDGFDSLQGRAGTDKCIIGFGGGQQSSC